MISLKSMIFKTNNNFENANTNKVINGSTSIQIFSVIYVLR